MKKGKSIKSALWHHFHFKFSKTAEELSAETDIEIIMIIRDINEKIQKFKHSTALNEIFECCEKKFNTDEHMVMKHNNAENYWKCTIKVFLPENNMDLILAISQDRHKKKAQALAYKYACSELSVNEEWRKFFIAAMLGTLDTTYHLQKMIALLPPLYNTNKALFDANVVSVVSQFLLSEEENASFNINKAKISDITLKILQNESEKMPCYSFTKHVGRLTVNAQNFSHFL